MNPIDEIKGFKIIYLGKFRIVVFSQIHISSDFPNINRFDEDGEVQSFTVSLNFKMSDFRNDEVFVRTPSFARSDAENSDETNQDEDKRLFHFGNLVSFEFSIGSSQIQTWLSKMILDSTN